MDFNRNQVKLEFEIADQASQTVMGQDLPFYMNSSDFIHPHVDLMSDSAGNLQYYSDQILPLQDESFVYDEDAPPHILADARKSALQDRSVLSKSFSIMESIFSWFTTCASNVYTLCRNLVFGIFTRPFIR